MSTPPRAGLTIDSPIGPIVIEVADDAVVALHMSQPGRAPEHRSDDHDILRRAARQLDEYFRGDRRQFDIAVAFNDTPFRVKVWRAMARIPFGQTVTYGDLAREVGSAPRAIGGACGANPAPIIFPCHRVVASNGGLGGFSGGAGCDTKTWLLEHEGARLM